MSDKNIKVNKVNKTDKTNKPNKKPKTKREIRPLDMYTFDVEGTSFDVENGNFFLIVLRNMKTGQEWIFDPITHPHPPSKITPQDPLYIGERGVKKLTLLKPFALHFREFYLNNRGVYFAHNGSKYDFLVARIFNDMNTKKFLGRGYRSLRMVTHSGSAFIDSMNIFPNKLDNLAEKDTPFIQDPDNDGPRMTEKSKLQIFASSVDDYLTNKPYYDDRDGTNTGLRDRIIKYCRKDCEVLSGALTEFFKITNTVIKKTDTVLTFGNISKRYMDSFQTEHKLSRVPLISSELDSLMRSYYYGGINVLVKKGIYKNCSVYDLTAAYLSVQSCPTGLPVGDVEFITDPEGIALHFLNPFTQDFPGPNVWRHPNELLCGIEAFLDVEVKLLEPGPFLRVMYENINEYPRKGWARVHVTAAELNIMLKFGTICPKNYKIHSIRHACKKVSLHKYAHHVHNKRLSAKTVKEKQSWKNIGNSGYGHFGMDGNIQMNYVPVEDAKKKGYEAKEGRIFPKRYCDVQFVLEDPEKPSFKNVILAASIAAGARCYLLYLIHMNHETFNYCDTDSIFLINLKDSKPNLGIFEIGNDLCQIKCEHENVTIYFCGRKIYRIDDVDKNRSKGTTIKGEKDMRILALTDLTIKGEGSSVLEVPDDCSVYDYIVKSVPRIIRGDDHGDRVRELEKIMSSKVFESENIGPMAELRKISRQRERA